MVLRELHISLLLLFICQNRLKLMIILINLSLCVMLFLIRILV